ncbi:MAG: CPBP family intramembrane glutamic endopeptidase [Pseudomonadota bacterium]
MPYDTQDTPAIHRRRLQRPANAAGFRVETFVAVIRRHGLTMGCIAAILLFTASAWPALVDTTLPLRSNPTPYLVGVCGLLIFFTLWSRRRPFTTGRQTLWITYLLYISIVEEIAFRLLLPILLSDHVERLPAHVISNAIFAALHYVTLRWRLVNCIGTFFGAMGLSYLMARGDLALVILVHWLGTFLNTPAPPAK